MDKVLSSTPLRLKHGGFRPYSKWTKLELFEYCKSLIEEANQSPSAKHSAEQNQKIAHLTDANSKLTTRVENLIKQKHDLTVLLTATLEQVRELRNDIQNASFGEGDDLFRGIHMGMAYTKARNVEFKLTVGCSTSGK